MGLLPFGALPLVAACSSSDSAIEDATSASASAGGEGGWSGDGSGGAGAGGLGPGGAGSGGDDGSAGKPPGDVKGFSGKYASPTIVHDGTKFHAYFAKQTVGGKNYNVPHATFTEAGDWKLIGEALPNLGNQADDTGGYPVWAPAAAKIDATHWMLYYTAQLAGAGEKKCIWRAHASDAHGPFVDDFPGPIVCSDDGHWSIDPYLVKDAAGKWHLAARIDEGDGINTIKIRELGPQAQFFAPGSSWVMLTKNAPGSWEQPVLENAGVVRLAPATGEPHWFVFYSGGAWADNSYAVGYADCGTSINGPCEKKTPNGPWLSTDKSAGVFGPGTPTFYEDSAGDTMMSVQAWQYSGGKSNPKNHEGQIMRTYKMSVSDAYKPKAMLVRVDLH